MRKYWDDVENVSEAIARWNELRKELLMVFRALAFGTYTGGKQNWKID